MGRPRFIYRHTLNNNDLVMCVHCLLEQKKNPKKTLDTMSNEIRMNERLKRSWQKKATFRMIFEQNKSEFFFRI